MLNIPVGARVRHSRYVTDRKRDYWNSLGDYTRKSRAKDDLDECIAERGTVTGHKKGNPKIGSMDGYEVKWDNGSVSSCLPHMIDEVKE